MIKQKKKVCKSCQKENFIFSKERCKSCASKEDYKSIPKQTTKNKIAKKEKSDLLKPFFQKHENIIKSKGLCCQNCGSKLVASFWEVAHILSKSRYKSIMTEDDNILYLCAGLSGENNCHKFLDDKAQNNLEILRTLPIFATLKERYIKIKDKVTERGKELEILEQLNNEN